MANLSLLKTVLKAFGPAFGNHKPPFQAKIIASQIMWRSHFNHMDERVDIYCFARLCFQSWNGDDNKQKIEKRNFSIAHSAASCGIEISRSFLVNSFR